MKVIFIDTVHPVLEEKLLEHGFQTDHYTGNNREEWLALCPHYDGFVIRSKFILDKEALDASTQLKFIARAGAGMENIDVTYAESKGIICFNSPEGNRDSVGEHALGMLLMLLHHLKKADLEVREGIWLRAENRGTEIMGKTVGIIGYGNTGSRFAKKLSGLDCRILVYDKYKSASKDSHIEWVDMQEIFEQADIVSLHISLSEETHYLVDKEFIESMHKPFFFINTSRGKNVHTSDLVDGLKSGKVNGACLDVLEYESSSFESMQNNPQLEYLIKAENVVLAPHIAGWTHESNQKMSLILAEKILQKFK